MTLELNTSPYFSADFELQVAWYTEHARRYSDSVAQSLGRLCENPGIGVRCSFKHPKLSTLRFCQVVRPFQKHIIFYRFDDESLFAERVMHGSRDLSNRLLEPPRAD